MIIHTVKSYFAMLIEALESAGAKANILNEMA
jgi:hypothetical protein